MTEQMTAAAHQLLQDRVSGDYKARSEDARDPQTVQAMQLAINPVSYTHLTLPTTPYV